MKCKLVVVMPSEKEEEGQSQPRKEREMPNRSRKKWRAGDLSWVNEKKKKQGKSRNLFPFNPGTLRGI